MDYQKRSVQLAGVGLALITASCASSITVCDKPNIILINVDDLGWQELGAYGQKKIKTPHLDKMAAEGLRFTQFYAGAAVCAPSRCNLMTGKHGGHAYVRDNYEVRSHKKVDGKHIYGGQFPIPDSEITIAELLKEQGYATGCFGKWGLGGQGTTGDPLNQGFDTYYGYNCQRNAHNLYPHYLEDNDEIDILEGNTRGLTGEIYGPQIVADNMLKFIKDNRSKRFFLYYPTVLPHLPLQAPDEDIAAYKGKWKEEPHKKGRGYLPHPTPRACYAAMISFMDKQIGRMFAELEKQGIADNTVVIFTSDNGTTFLKSQVDYEFFESVGPLRGLKGSLHEGGIRVPMIVWWPGKVKAGRVTDFEATQYDLLATLSDISGATTPKGTDSLSILPEILGQDGQKRHEYLFWDFAGYGGQLAVRMGKWKGIKKNLKKNPNAKLELYDLEADIGEKNNVVAKYPEIAKKIEKIMLEDRTEPTVDRFKFGKYK